MSREDHVSTHEGHIYEFGDFRIDPAERLLLRQGEPVPLPPKVFDTLIVLVENRGRLVEKDELMARLWPDALVEEATLARNVSSLRKVLGCGSDDQKYLETVPKHGYRFVAPVRELTAIDQELMIARRTTSRIVVDETDNPGDSARLVERQDQALLRSRLGGMHPASLAIAAALAVAAGLFYFGRPGAKKLESALDVRSIAVLPFTPISAEQRDEYLELGMADALITNLSSVDRIVVRPTGSVRKYASLETDPIAAGRALRVDCVLEGTVQRMGDRIRVTARLRMVDGGRALWTGEFDERSADIFAVQDRISEQIARALALRLTGEEKKLLAKRYTEDSRAYELYQKGRFFWNKRTEDGLKKGIQYFEQAIDRDPNYTLAYAGLADSYALLDLYSTQRPSEIFLKARAAAETALRLDNSMAEAHASLAYVKYYYDWDWPGAEAEFKHAIDAGPHYATAHQWYAEYLFYMARFDESIVEINRAHELDPTSLAISTELGSPYYYMRQYDTAMEKYAAAREMDPGFPLAIYCTALCYGQKGMFQKATETMTGWQTAIGAYFLASSGRNTEARYILARLIQSAREGYSSVHVARVLTGLGEKEQALGWLKKAVEERDERVVMLKVDPHFDSLRGDARYQELLRRINLQ